MNTIKNNTLKRLAGIMIVNLFINAAFINNSLCQNNQGNDDKYSVANTPSLPNSPIAGKTIYFLGSSVTLGAASLEESFVDYIRKRNNCTCIKEAVSGTTLRDDGTKSYIKRLKNFNVQAKVDAFVCQLSTNDVRSNGIEKLGAISPSFNQNDFDLTTTTGAMEYIISYAKNTWKCPVFFYTNSNYHNPDYEKLIARLYELQKKWGLYIIDLYNSTEINTVSQEQLNLYILPDFVHPRRAGYKLWWTPFFEKHLYKIIGSPSQAK
jgi:hypothetical protein